MCKYIDMKCGVVVLVLVAASRLSLGAEPPQAAIERHRQMEIWWADMEKSDLEASRALLALSVEPESTVAFLTTRIKRLKIDASQVRSLLASLASEKDDVWKPAYEELLYFDPRLAIDLELLMQEVTGSPTRQRLVEILSGRAQGSLAGKDIELSRIRDDWFNFRSGGGAWGADPSVSKIKHAKWTRAIRCVALLEHIGSPGAIRILEEMVSGHPDAEPTRAAKQALDRIWNKNMP